ncbi:homocysteine S-methyltransferase [Companilactobacillus zhongbaensis]|uniref:homocysteine S-methyltransferase n=1 Tax=Companilactobacillus zhongbaensis TaxID=2486009 RepID=UPI000F767C3C|nr:homocysteine S-methyltransferase [Companilactobacillus zhongbaensis]
MTDLISENIQQRPGLVVDGAMATELEKLGVNTDNDLWSATALIENPEAILAVHKSFFQAGADVAITNTYQANVKKFMKMGLSKKASQDLIIKAVQIADQARDEYYGTLSEDERKKRAKHPLIAGSVGPYGAYLADGSEYRGDYQLTEKEFMDFHQTRMELLDQAGVDLFAFETQPSFAESKALVNLLKRDFPKQTAWLSFSIKDPETLCDGTPLQDAVKYFNVFDQVAAIGVNCTTLENIDQAVKNIRAVTDKPIVVYPNNGDIYDPVTKTWTKNPQDDDFAELTPKWITSGADLIGGCCRTTPADIKEIASFINK